MERICYLKNGFQGYASDELKEELKNHVKENEVEK